jgi:fructokinase
MRIGIDLGGTKIEAVVLAPEGAVAFRQRRPTPRNDYDATLQVIAALVDDAERAIGHLCTVGLGMPGTISPATGLVKNANSTWLNGRRLHQDIEARLHRPVRLANDANCFALSEASDGAAAGAPVVFGVIIGTGCGGGIVVNGRVVTGPNAIAGEWGHNPLPWPDDSERPGPDCYCGKRGCLESFISGPGFARDYAIHSGEAMDSIDAAGVVARASAGDAQAEAALHRYTHRVARGLATIVNVLDPDVIVLGGGMSNVPHLYDALPRHLPPFVFSDAVVTRIVPPKHGDSSGVRGAAWLWSLDEARAVTSAAPVPRAGAGTAGA